MDDRGYDLIIRARRIVCPASGLDGPGTVAVRGDRIVAVEVGEEAPTQLGPTRSSLDLPDGVLLPGLVDLHAHPAVEDSKYGIDPDAHMLPRGTTTVLSQGDAGALNWPRYREQVIRGARARVQLAINLAAPGESKPTGCLEDLRDADVEACVRAIEDGGADIWGIAVNVSETVCGANDPREVTRLALAAAERTARPLLFGARRSPDWPLEEQLALLRPGDVVTYCLHGLPQSIVQDGRVRACVWEARERGVRFDTGHGMQSFDFEVAEAAIRQGFLPDTISTDQYRRHLGAEPPHDLPLTISKLLAAGLSESDAWPRVTQVPAELLGLVGEVGALAPGASADLVGLSWNAGPEALRDTGDKTRSGGRWEPALVVRAGEVVASPSD
jgi:dihydroorotase